MSKVIDLLQRRLLLMREAGALYHNVLDLRKSLRSLVEHEHASWQPPPSAVCTAAEGAIQRADALIAQLEEPL